MNLSLEVSENLTAPIRYIAERLEGALRVEASQAMGLEVQQLVVEHLTVLAGSRHDTANRLGASPTNFIAGAVDAASGADVVRADGDGVSLSMRHPVIARAYRDIHIVPKGHPFLAIPANALAYGRSPRECAEVQFVSRKEPIRTDIAAFFLVRSVTQRRDASLMPGGEEINARAALGLTTYVKKTIRESGLSAT